MIERPEAIEILEQMKSTFQKDEWMEKDIMALERAISDMRRMSYLTNRPCDVCKFNENGNGCKKWTCVFEDDVVE